MHLHLPRFLSVLPLLFGVTLSVSQPQWIRKPTNSVTIRQSASNMCANELLGSFVPHPEDCRLFYLCMESGDAVLASCPSTMLFNAENKICDAPNNVRCVNGTNSVDAGNNGSDPSTRPGDSDVNEMVTDAASYCAALLAPQAGTNQIVYIGSSSSCNNYYICYYGQALLQSCSAELHWNAVTAKCDLPERAQCTLFEQNVTPVAPPADSSNISNDLINCPSYGQHLYPHMRRCEFFIYCVKGYATLQQCPFYYYFDVVTKSCQKARSAVCVRDLNFPRRKN